MTTVHQTNESHSNTLCKSCGLCCDGHLFSWAKLRPAELDPAEALGMHIFRSHPNQRGFSQPCPLWQGICTIYESAHYPIVCRNYKCKLLKELLADKTSLGEALTVVQQAKSMIAELEPLLPGSQDTNFRERLVAYLEGPPKTDPRSGPQARALLEYYEEYFGVNDLIDNPDAQ